MNKTCIIIAGPTAVGKTTTAIELAKYFKTEIISSDSRQCYRELNIGVAKPSPQQLASVLHHFINSHSIHDDVTAAEFETFALNVANKVFDKSDIAVIVGGTGLYIKSFCDGLDDIPAASVYFKKELQQRYQEEGIDWLTKELAEKDPRFYEHGEMQNPHRMMRALEVMHASGRSILSFYTGQKKLRPFNIIKVALALPREYLYENINTRTEQMMNLGLLHEAKELLVYKSLKPLQTVGYRELFAHLEGGISLEEAVKLIKQNTRHYAKRQMTWFKKDAEFTWMSPGNATDVISFIKERLKL